MEARLDRGLVNDCWQSIWPTTSVQIGATLGSDHSPVVVVCEPQFRKKRKLFRFKAFWIRDRDCKEIVRETWNQSRMGSLIERWNYNINIC